MSELNTSLANSERSPLGIPAVVHHYIYLGSLIVLMIGMPTSTFLTSVPQFVIVGNWLLEGRLREKMRRFFSTPAAILLCSFYIMHLLGLLYTSEAGMDYGLEDVRKKIPLFLLPFIFSSMGMISVKEKRLVIFVFMLSETVVTFYGIYLLITHQFTDIREISPFVDPVRQGMMLVLSFFLLLHYVFTNKWRLAFIPLLIWAGWMLVYLFIMQSLTSVILVLVISIALLLIYAVKSIRKKKVSLGAGILMTALIAAGGVTGYGFYFVHHYFPATDKINFSRLDKQTRMGNTYENDTLNYSTENGHHVALYVCQSELKDGWNKRSRIPYDSLDKKGNGIRYTLIRYLASKNLRKDEGGVAQLTGSDINAVESGIPNYRFNSLTSMPYRIYQVLWELNDYRHGGNANGHSLTQRFEFWKAALGIIKSHPIVGVGTGNVRIAFDAEYDRTHSSLNKESRLRSHNQYLEIGVAFGIIGIIWLALSLFYPAFGTKKIFTYPYFIFWLIIMIAFLTEDTLETQAGATYYAFFNSFFLFL